MKNPIKDFLEKKVFKSVVAGNVFKFGEYFDDEGYYIEPIFRDIAIDPNGIVTVITEQNGKIYQYDQDGNMLVAFGGLGEQNGKFTRPSSIAVNSEGIIYIVDRLNNNIQLFKPTEFIILVQEATTAYNQGDYEKSYQLWNQVLVLHENYELAHAGIAKAYYKQEKWKESMEESKLVGNRDIYTQSFDEYTYVVLRDNFVLILFLALLVIVGEYFFLTRSIRAGKAANWNFIKNKGKKMGIWEGIKFSYNVLFHPIDTMEAVRSNKERLNMAVPFIIMAVAYAVRIAYIYIVHYPLASIEIRDANALFEAVKLLIIPLTWVPALFAVTSIADGESKFPEMFFTTSLILVPFIFINTHLMFLSKLLSKTQQSWYGVFTSMVYVWMIIILFAALKILNNYSVGKTIRMMIITLFVMLIIWLVLGMFYVLSARVIQFALGVFNEFRVSIL